MAASCHRHPAPFEAQSQPRLAPVRRGSDGILLRKYRASRPEIGNRGRHLPIKLVAKSPMRKYCHAYDAGRYGDARLGMEARIIGKNQRRAPKASGP